MTVHATPRALVRGGLIAALIGAAALAPGARGADAPMYGVGTNSNTAIASPTIIVDVANEIFIEVHGVTFGPQGVQRAVTSATRSTGPKRKAASRRPARKVHRIAVRTPSKAKITARAHRRHR